MKDNTLSLYELFSVCDKNSNVVLTQNGKRVVVATKVGQECFPFSIYPVEKILHKNRQLRISIGSERVHRDVFQERKIYLSDIMPLLEDGEKLALSDKFSENIHKPIDNIKLSPLDILIIS